MSPIRPAAVLALAAILGSAAGARQDPPPGPANPPLVFLQEGELPLILSSPHGGAREIPGVPPRKGEGMKKGPTGFVVARDTGLEELAHDLAAAIRERTGKKPYVVVASFHRRHLDCNRPPEFAYEHDGAKAVYEEYYGALRRYGAEAVRKFGGGLVVDLHGQGTAADKVFRGTQNGQTTALLQERFGRGLQVGPDSLMGRLKARGWTVHPDGEGPEAAGFSGGHIVRTFGRREAGTDAVQLEFGMDYRREGSGRPRRPSWPKSWKRSRSCTRGRRSRSPAASSNALAVGGPNEPPISGGSASRGRRGPRPQHRRPVRGSRVLPASTSPLRT